MENGLQREEKSDSKCLWCRRIEASIRRRDANHPLHPRVVHYLETSGFLGVSKITFIQLDWHLITALVEKWRPETHTFHMTVGEVTITLQDISIQFDLPIDGPPVTGSTSHNWNNLCRDLLGITPNVGALDGGRLKITYLLSHTRDIEDNMDDIDEEMIVHFTRDYILLMISGLLFPDKSSNKAHLMVLPLLEDLEPGVSYNWGSAALAWLYRQLCVASKRNVHEIG